MILLLLAVRVRLSRLLLLLLSSCACQIFFSRSHSKRNRSAKMEYFGGENNRREESSSQEKHIYEVQNGFKECLRQFFLLRLSFYLYFKFSDTKLLELDTADKLYFIKSALVIQKITQCCRSEMLVM